MRTRSPERTEFLTDVLVTAVENYGYGWFKVRDYNPDEGTVRIWDTNDSDGPQGLVVTLDTIAHGLTVIRNADQVPYPTMVWAEDDNGPTYVPGYKFLLWNVKDGKRLYMHSAQRKAILAADRKRDAGDLDVTDALAILECAVFGAVTYC